MIRQIYGLFLKRDVVNKANTPYLLSQVDVLKKEHHLPIDVIELGNAVTSELVKLGPPVEAKKIAI